VTSPAYLPPLHNGDVEDPFWWTGVLGNTPPIPANLTRGLSIIINPLVRLPWLFNGGPQPPWAADPMLFNGRVSGGVAVGKVPKMARESRFDFWSRWIRDAILFGRGTFTYDPDSDNQPRLGSLRRHPWRDLSTDLGSSNAGGDRWYLTVDGTEYPVDDEGVLRGSDGAELEHVHFMRGHEGGVLGMHAAELRAAAGVTEYAANLFDGNVPSGVLQIDQPMTQDQANATREEWRRQQKQRSIAVLGNGAKYQQVVMSPVDAAVGQMMTLSNTQVAHMLELPASMLDGFAGGSMTYSNRAEDQRAFVDGPLSSWASRVEESISALLPWGQSMSIDFTEYTKTTTGGAAPPADPPPPVVPASEEVPSDDDSDSA
jgi:HK97 family phage portal protein